MQQTNSRIWIRAGRIVSIRTNPDLQHCLWIHGWRGVLIPTWDRCLSHPLYTHKQLSIILKCVFFIDKNKEFEEKRKNRGDNKNRGDKKDGHNKDGHNKDVKEEEEKKEDEFKLPAGAVLKLEGKLFSSQCEFKLPAGAVLKLVGRLFSFHCEFKLPAWVVLKLEGKPFSSQYDF